MANYLMESATAKLERATYLLGQLSQEVDRDRGERKYGTEFVTESRTGDLVMKAVMPRELFVHYSLLVSEVIGHARSALDHAIWEMVPIAGKSRRTAFPIFSRQPDYINLGLQKIQGINSQAATVIESQQPFGPNPETNFLYVLNELWNSDKHRLLNFCAEYPVGIAISYVGPGTEYKQRFAQIPAVVKHGTEFFRERHPGSGVTVTAEVARIGMIFDGGPFAGHQVLPLMSKLVDSSRQLVETLANTS